MAKADDLKRDLGDINEELILLNDQFANVGSKINEQIEQQVRSLEGAVKNVASSFQKDLTKAIGRSSESLSKFSQIQGKIAKGQDASKDIEKELVKVQKEREVTSRKLELLKRSDVTINQEAIEQLEESLATQEKQLQTLQDLNTAQIAQRGITGNILQSAKAYLITLDKSGLAAQLLNGDLDTTQKLTLASEGAMLALANAALAGSNNINNLQKNLGISYEAAYDLQNSLAITSATSDKLYVTSALLNKAFTDLAEQTGIVSDFGGDTLVTMTALTKQLGLGTAEASQLALLARTQSTDTEGVLENTVATVSALNRQNGVAISAKAVLNDVATASKSIVVSLGMSPEILAEAATEARALGLSLSQVDAIAGSLLDFESSIENELAFQMLTGKEINLDKARQLALDNDLAGLSEEIANNAGITEAYATGNRIQQEAAAKALGMSREDLGNMVYQQELLNLGAEGFTEAYGETAYQSMLAMSASDKFEASLEKVKGVIGDIGTLFAPIIDGFAFLVGAIASSKAGLIAISAIMGGLIAYQSALAVKSMVTAVASIFSESFKMGPILGIGLAGAGIAGLYAASQKAQSVEDGIADSSRGPFTITDSYGKMAVTAKGDNLAVSPNINSGGGSDSKMLSVLEQIAKKDSNVYMDSSKVGYAESLSYSKL